MSKAKKELDAVKKIQDAKCQTPNCGNKPLKYDIYCWECVYRKYQCRPTLQEFNVVVAIVFKFINKEITPRKAEALMYGIMTGLNT